MREALRMLAVAVGVLCCVTPAAAACEAGLEARIIDLYSARYYEQWGEMAPRQKVDDIIGQLAMDVLAAPGTHDVSECKFSLVVERSLPTPISGAVRLSPAAKAIGITFEFVSDATQFCIGLNNVEKVGLPPDKRYPHQVRRFGGTVVPLRALRTLHYAMKCFGRDGTVVGYRYY